MKHISRFIFSALLLLCGFFGMAQDVQKTEADSIKTNRYGLRVGIDAFKLSRAFWEKDYKGLEIVGDYRLTKRHYIAAEIGNENKTVDEPQLSFTAKGTYIKAGFNYNAYENWLDMENLIYVGLRYGVSSFSQTLNNYSIYNRDHYFGDQPVVPSGEKYSGLSAQWAEFVAGVNAKVFNNIYVGFSVRVSKLISNKKPDNFDNLYIPGFNRTYDGDFGAGFNYTVSYFIPIYKTKNKIEKKK